MICMPFLNLISKISSSHFLFCSKLIIVRIKHWRKHGGSPPEGVGQAVGKYAGYDSAVDDGDKSPSSSELTLLFPSLFSLIMYRSSCSYFAKSQ